MFWCWVFFMEQTSLILQIFPHLDFIYIHCPFDWEAFEGWNGVSFTLARKGNTERDCPNCLWSVLIPVFRYERKGIAFANKNNLGYNMQSVVLASAFDPS